MCFTIDNLAGIAMRAINENKELHTKIQNIYQVLNESLLEISHWREFRKFQDEEFGVPVGEQTKYFDTEEWNLVEDRAREMYIQLTSELKIYLPNNVQFIRKQDA